MKVHVDKDSVRPFLVVLSTRADQAYVPGLAAACPAARPHRPRCARRRVVFVISGSANQNGLDRAAQKGALLKPTLNPASFQIK
jgi:hypothetical protein